MIGGSSLGALGPSFRIAAFVVIAVGAAASGTIALERGTLDGRTLDSSRLGSSPTPADAASLESASPSSSGRFGSLSQRSDGADPPPAHEAIADGFGGAPGLAWTIPKWANAELLVRALGGAEWLRPRSREIVADWVRCRDEAIRELLESADGRRAAALLRGEVTNPEAAELSTLVAACRVTARIALAGCACDDALYARVRDVAVQGFERQDREHQDCAEQRVDQAIAGSARARSDPAREGAGREIAGRESPRSESPGRETLSHGAESAIATVRRARGVRCAPPGAEVTGLIDLFAVAERMPERRIVRGSVGVHADAARAALAEFRAGASAIKPSSAEHRACPHRRLAQEDAPLPRPGGARESAGSADAPPGVARIAAQYEHRLDQLLRRIEGQERRLLPLASQAPSIERVTELKERAKRERRLLELEAIRIARESAAAVAVHLEQAEGLSPDEARALGIAWRREVHWAVAPRLVGPTPIDAATAWLLEAPAETLTPEHAASIRSILTRYAIDAEALEARIVDLAFRGLCGRCRAGLAPGSPAWIAAEALGELCRRTDRELKSSLSPEVYKELRAATRAHRTAINVDLLPAPHLP
ncbi:MAG TPA: hypothetical protein PKC43_00255 [Phycisphaerales bacterium]|nr:hypothetical protein [Phycisphaerales bacterium]HMP35856.1 hypothetical protein [Phycisphaerales bacterium]